MVGAFYDFMLPLAVGVDWPSNNPPISTSVVITCSKCSTDDIFSFQCAFSNAYFTQYISRLIPALVTCSMRFLPCGNLFSCICVFCVRVLAICAMLCLFYFC